MICKFCHREFEDGMSECPYCHYVVETTAKVLSQDERDTFEGVTIETDGSIHDSNVRREEQGQDAEEETREAQEESGSQGGFHLFNLSSSLLWGGLVLLIILGVVLTTLLAAAIYFLPVIIIGVLVYFVARIFF